MIKTCIFDMDGTLANTLQDITNAGNYALTQLGYPTHPAQDFKEFIGNGIFTLIALAMPEPARTESNVNKALSFMLDYYDQHLLDFTLPYDGNPELLHALADHSIAICVVTNKADHQAKRMAHTLFPDIPFLSILGEREGSKIKPDPTDALTCARLSGAEPRECAFIGDSRADVLTGRNAGMVCVSVDWGFRSREFLENASPDHIVSTPQELRDVVLAGYK